MKDKIRVGLIGAGRIGKIHAENIMNFIADAELVRLVDVKLDSAMESWGKKLEIPHISNDPEHVFKDDTIDAVIICSSTDTHADFIIKAAQAGKHIFCEKPIDVTVPKVLAAIDAVDKAGVKLQVGFNRRFDHNFKKIHELNEQNDLGDIHIIKITSRDPAPPLASYVAVSGGIFLDMTIHDFDMARFQAGSEVTQVYATGAVLVDPEIGKAGDIDTAIITLKFMNGALGVIDNSRKAVYGYDQRVEVFGAKGSAIAENDHPNTVRLLNENGIYSEKPLYFFLERYKGAFIDEMRAFIHAVKINMPTAVTGKDGLEALLIALAATKSLKENRSVSIEEIKKEYGVHL